MLERFQGKQETRVLGQAETAAKMLICAVNRRNFSFYTFIV